MEILCFDRRYRSSVEFALHGSEKKKIELFQSYFKVDVTFYKYFQL